LAEDLASLVAVDLASLVAVDLASLVAVECSLSPLTISRCREQAVSSGSGFAGSKLVAVEWTSLVGVKVASLGASW